MFSQKLNAAGLKYEVGVCIQTGHIVWVNGGFPCGKSDLTIAREHLVHLLSPGEKIIADKIYQDAQYFITPRTFPYELDLQKQIRARHETVNGKLKRFACLHSFFRHNKDKHVNCFMAVAEIVQMIIVTEEPLYIWDEEQNQWDV
jgi:hypothetical protein